MTIESICNVVLAESPVTIGPSKVFVNASKGG
jgi:hypothetical protein